MPRGGSRPGAGRKKGVSSLREKAEKTARRLGKEPLEVMLKAMNWHYARKDYDKAAAHAQAAAPYCHPRLASVEQRVRADVRTTLIADEPLTDAEWEEQFGG